MRAPGPVVIAAKCLARTHGGDPRVGGPRSEVGAHDEVAETIPPLARCTVGSRSTVRVPHALWPPSPAECSASALDISLSGNACQGRRAASRAPGSRCRRNCADPDELVSTSVTAPWPTGVVRSSGRRSTHSLKPQMSIWRSVGSRSRRSSWPNRLGSSATSRPPGSVTISGSSFAGSSLR